MIGGIKGIQCVPSPPPPSMYLGLAIPDKSKICLKGSISLKASSRHYPFMYLGGDLGDKREVFLIGNNLIDRGCIFCTMCRARQADNRRKMLLHWI